MKKLNFFVIILIFASLVFPECRTRKVDILAEANTIRNLEEQLIGALQTSDPDKIISFFASEAVSMRSNSPIFSGAQAIRREIEAQFTDTALLFTSYTDTISTIEVSASGDLAYVRGHSCISIKTSNGLAEEVSKWIDIWKKSDGQWKVVVSIANSDKPL